MQMMPLCDFDCRYNLGRGPFGGTPIESLSPFDNIMHCPDGFFNRGGFIGPVTVDQIHIIKLKALERAIDSFNQPFAVERVLFIDIIMYAPIELCGNQITAAPPAQLLERRAHYLFRLATCVYFRVIEEVYSRLIGSRQHVNCGFDPYLIMKCNP